MAKVKDVAINVSENDWTSKEVQQKAVGTVEGKKTALVNGGKLTINFDIVVPGKSIGTGALAESNLNYGKDAIKPALAAFKKLVSGPLTKGLEKVVELHEGGDSKGFSNASAALDKVNKYIKDSLDDLRPKMREAVAKKLGVSPKELLTIGTCKFKEMKIERGVFADEVELDDASPADVSGALKKKGWQYCGVAWSGESAVIGIDNKKAFKKSDLKQLGELLGEASPNLVGGRVKAESQSNVVFQFNEKDKRKAPNEGTIERVLRKALNIQTGIKMSNVKATPFVKEFDADKKGKSKEAEPK